MPITSLDPDDYPNKESFVAAKGARRRALSALDSLEEDAVALKRRIEHAAYGPYGSDAQRFMGDALKLAVEFAAMELMRDVLEWHAADKAEQEVKDK